MRSSPITPTAQSPSTSSSSIALRMPCSGAENSQFFFASANVSPAPPAIARPMRLSCWALPMRSNRGERDGLLHGRSPGEAAAVERDQLGAGFVVAQREDESPEGDLEAVGKLVQQSPVLDVLQCLREGLVPGRGRGDIGRVVVLARVGVAVGVGQLQHRVIRVVQLPVGIPSRPIMEVLRRLDVERSLLVARRLPVSETLLEIAERVAHRLDRIRTQLKSHPVFLSITHRHGRSVRR